MLSIDEWGEVEMFVYSGCLWLFRLLWLVIRIFMRSKVRLLLFFLVNVLCIISVVWFLESVLVLLIFIRMVGSEINL